MWISPFSETLTQDIAGTFEELYKEVQDEL